MTQAPLEDYFGPSALAEILFSHVNPSGRLPVSFEGRWEDNPSHYHYYPATGTNRIEYGEGVFVGYRGYDYSHTSRCFPSDSESPPPYSGSTIWRCHQQSLPLRRRRPDSPLFQASFSVSNTGARSVAAVAELYIAKGHASVPHPPKELKGFVKIDLKPGETRRVSIPLDARSLSFYDVKTQRWRAEAGAFKVMIGSSSEKIELSSELKLDDTIVTAP